MSIKNSLLVSYGEKRTYKLLLQYSPYLNVLSKVRFFDVIDWNTSGISEQEHSYLQKTHFDFLVCKSNENLTPLFAVEFDGVGESFPIIDPYRNLKKKTKTRICSTEGFPLLWMEFEDIKDIEGSTILDFIIENYLEYNLMNELKSEGIASLDDAHGIVFKPTLTLLSKYRRLVRGVRNKKINIQKEYTEVESYIEVEINGNTHQINKFVRFRNIDFPGFSSLLIAEDLAQYQCLKELDMYFEENKLN